MMQAIEKRFHLVPLERIVGTYGIIPIRSWYIDCGELPEIEVVAQAPPANEDIYHHVGEPWWHVDLFGKPYRWDFSISLWEEIPPSAMPLAVYLDLVHGQSTTIDCAPTGTSGNTRKRDLVVSTEPIFNDLWITSITKTRESTPHYGHHHTPDNNAVLCRGATDVDDGATNDNGIFQFFYRGPEAAGRTVVTVNWKDPRDEETGSISMTFEKQTRWPGRNHGWNRYIFNRAGYLPSRRRHPLGHIDYKNPYQLACSSLLCKI